MPAHARQAFALSHFWAQHQAFFSQVITAFKVPECIRQIEAALTRNESVVISIIGTAEAKSKVLVAKAAAEGSRLELCGVPGYGASSPQLLTNQAFGQYGRHIS